MVFLRFAFGLPEACVAATLRRQGNLVLSPPGRFRSDDLEYRNVRDVAIPTGKTLRVGWSEHGPTTGIR